MAYLKVAVPNKVIPIPQFDIAYAKIPTKKFTGFYLKFIQHMENTLSEIYLRKYLNIDKNQLKYLHLL